MKNIKTLITSILILATTSVFAQTNVAPTKTTEEKVSWASQFVKNWLKDNTNFFDQGTVIVGAGGLYSYGKYSDASGDKKGTFGAVLSVMFPIDEKGQVSVGFYGAHFNSDYFVGSLATTIGKTIHIPGINQDVFAYVEAGPAINLNNPDNMLVQGFTGLVWKHDVIKARNGREPFTLFVTGGYGHCSGWDGSVQVAGVGLGHKF